MGLKVTYGPNVITDSLVFTLDAANKNSYPGSGTNWYDLSGNGNNGTLTNGPTFDPTNLGNIVFDGVDDYLNFGDKDAFTNQSFTYELTFKPQSFNRVIINKYQSGGFEYDFGFYNNVLYGWVCNSPYNGRTAPITNYTSLNTWGHYVWSVDSTTGYTTKLYFNGVQIDDTNFSSGTPTSIPNTSISLTVGVDGYGLLGPIYGSMGFIRLYNKVLTQQEINQNYNAIKSRYGY